MPFYKFGCSFATMHNIQKAWCSFCLFCDSRFELINYYMHYIHMYYKCIACESKMAPILNLIVGSSVGCPLNCPLFRYLKEAGCPLYPYMELVGSLICMAKFPWAAHWQTTPLPNELPTFSYFESVGCLLSCPLFPYMEVVGSLICMAKFPWTAHGQPTLTGWTTTFKPTPLSHL